MSLKFIEINNMINPTQMREISKVKSYEDIGVLRKRIAASDKVTEAKKKELLSWVDVRQGELWWETLPEPNIQTYVRAINKNKSRVSNDTSKRTRDRV